MDGQEHILRAEGLVKSFADQTVLNGLDLSVERGELYGLIGPDGAGKTTFFRIAATLMLADQGRVSISGKDVVADYKAIRQDIGYMPGDFSLYGDLSIDENLKVFSAIYGTDLKSGYALIEKVYHQLAPFGKRRARDLSGGMKQKLALCCALIHQPELLILDEPTTGVDPISRSEIWEVIKDLQAKGVSVLVSTPYMDEAKLCDRISLMDKGNILQTDTVEGILKAYDRTLWAVKGERMSSLLEAIRAIPMVDSVYAFGNEHHVVLKDEFAHQASDSGIRSFRDKLAEVNHKQVQVDPIRPSVEDCFIEMISGHEGN